MSSTSWVAAQQGPIRPLAYHPLDGRPGFKLALHVDAGRWYLYVAHLWHPGWSIVDVTDPEAPVHLAYLPGPENTWTIQVTIHRGLMATSLERKTAVWGGNPSLPFEEGVVLWDLADPVRPRRRGTFRTGDGGTHRNAFDEQGFLHLAARMAGYSGAIHVTLDVSDPDEPREVGRFHMAGQHVAAGEATTREGFNLHGPAMRVDDLLYLPYSGAGMVVLDASDPAQPSPVGVLDLHGPIGSTIAAHSVLPLPRRGIAIVNSEALAERCAEPANFAAIVDIADPRHPILRTFFPTPVPPPGLPYRSFAAKGGRFGPHNQHLPTTDSQHIFQSEEVCLLTYFNAGLRVYDIRDPHRVDEIAYLIPADPQERLGPLPRELVCQVEDVLVDARGVVYFTEKNSGLYIARWEGLGSPAEPAAGHDR